MARNVQILLLETVESTGIVGDVVHVRKGFARNFLLPRGLAETPSEAKIKDLQGKRKEAIKHLAELRKSREVLVEKLAGHEMTMIRSCNDLGILYAAVTQHELAAELEKSGFKGIADREIRLGQPIKRVGDYAVTVKFQLQAVPEEESIIKAKGKVAKKEDNAPLEAEIKLHVKPDRELSTGRRDRDEAPKAAEGAEGAEAGAEGGEAGGKRAKDKSAKFETAKPTQKEAAEKPAKAPKAEKADKGDKKADKKK